MIRGIALCAGFSGKKIPIRRAYLIVIVGLGVCLVAPAALRAEGRPMRLVARLPAPRPLLVRAAEALYLRSALIRVRMRQNHFVRKLLGPRRSKPLFVFDIDNTQYPPRYLGSRPAIDPPDRRKAWCEELEDLRAARQHVNLLLDELKQIARDELISEQGYAPEKEEKKAQQMMAEEWDLYNKMGATARGDTLVPGAVGFLQKLARGVEKAGGKILYLTARSDDNKEQTKKLMGHLGFPMESKVTELVMTPVGLRGKEAMAKWKADKITKMTESGQVLGVFDDSPGNLAKFREAGVNPWNLVLMRIYGDRQGKTKPLASRLRDFAYFDRWTQNGE